ncbi:MAG: dephospho-CoA kinase [Gammaproteobacteria bacterium HGW-Gammaproteobacteria-3]|nr:MAG: dephospho-CoA kinase [Gammaproteobacteria bacterium HGW-Gammaproteobacteria-3]
MRIGLTGGIGAGKTTVAQLFADLNVPVIDADVIARRLVEPGQPALAQIRMLFGPVVINPDGSLNRGELRGQVFADSQLKQKLEAILHPRVLANIQSEADALTAPYCLICIPLLFETGMDRIVDRVLVIDCPVATQITRVKQRDGLDEASIRAIIAAQAPRASRNAMADDLIDNGEANSRLAEQVKKLHNLYLSLSVK